MNKYSDHEIGKVIKLEGGYALLELKESDACVSCGAKSVCTAGKDGDRCMRIKNTLNVKVGDLVAFDTSESQQVQINLMQYGLPLIGFLIGLLGYFYILADFIPIPKEIGAFTSALVIMFGFGLITRLWSEKKAKSISLHSMKEIVNENT